MSSNDFQNNNERYSQNNSEISNKNHDVQLNSNSTSTRVHASKKSAYLTIIILSILLVTSIIVGITGAFFANTQNASGDITLGDPVNINITQNGSSVSTLTFSNNALPGDVFNQPIGVSVPADSTTSVVRVKLTLGNTLATPVEVTTTAQWVKGDDDYYYYNGTLAANQSANFATAITVPTTLTNTDANKVYTISIIAEAIQFANGAAEQLWTTAPQAWVTAYGTGTINND